jgi:deoxyribodipyrimidine photolyase-related protein
MVPNVYGMGLRKLYISSYNYILNTSNYKKGAWCEIWHALYYNFINQNKSVLKKTIYRSSIKNYNNMTDAEKKEIKRISTDYLQHQ